MATNSELPPVPTTPAPADAHFDEKTGIYGFFRRNQKRLLYSVGIFTLLTFSVSGPMLAAVDDLFARKQPMPTIEVGGQRVSLQPEDTAIYGPLLAQYGWVLSLAMPMVSAGDEGQSDLAEVYAILRRAAIVEGFDASLTEVDRAIEVIREKRNLASATQLAVQSGFSSLAQYRDAMREAMRIGHYVRMQTLMLDGSDAAVLQSVIADREKIAFKVASFDEKALEESLKKAGGMSDEDLRKWLDGKSDMDKNRIQVFDTNRVELKIGAALHADFDAAQWQEDALKDFKVGDEQLKKTYEQEKEARFKIEGTPPTYKPFEDEATKAEVTKLIQLDQVMNHLLGKLREKMNTAMEAANKELQKANEEWMAAQNAVSAATEKEATTKAQSAEKPEDAALKEAHRLAEEELRLAKEVVPAKDNAKKAADEAVKAERAKFDFAGTFAELTKDKKGFVQKAFTGKRNAEELKDLEAGELGLGQWPLAMYATFLQNKGDLSNQPGRTSKATILYQVGDLDVRPLKPWDKLKPLLEGAYYTELAKTQAEAKKKTMEESLLRLAKAKMPEKIAELEGKRVATVDEKLAVWEKQTQADIAKAEKTLADPRLGAGTQAHAAWTTKLTSLKEQLAKKDEKRQAIDKEVGAKIEADIAEAAKQFHAEVLVGAAADAGFSVADVGPYARELSQRPRFDKSFDANVVFLFQNHAQMKAGESTGVVQDSTSRRWIVGCCTKVEPLAASDVDRREFEMRRRGQGSYASQNANRAYGQAFTKKALDVRYRYQPPQAEGETKPAK